MLYLAKQILELCSS